MLLGLPTAPNACRRHEELGRCSRAVLTQPRYAQMCLGVVPSPAVVCMEEEMRLGLPPVAPLRGEDFVRWLYAGGRLVRGAVGCEGDTQRMRVAGKKRDSQFSKPES